MITRFRAPLRSMFVVFGLCQVLNAISGETPADLPGAKIATAEQVKRLLDNGVPVVDTRVGNEFAEAHIRGVINVPYK